MSDFWGIIGVGLWIIARAPQTLVNGFPLLLQDGSLVFGRVRLRAFFSFPRGHLCYTSPTNPQST